MTRNCLKCGHANAEATGAELEACPSCGAIYSRVEAAWAARPPRPVSPAHTEVRAHAAADDTVEEFAWRLRTGSLYPTFRSLVGLVYLMFLVLAAVAFVGGVMGAWTGSGASRVGVLFVGVFMGLLFLIVGKAMREMSLMLADLADAAVRIASRVRP